MAQRIKVEVVSGARDLLGLNVLEPTGRRIASIGSRKRERLAVVVVCLSFGLYVAIGMVRIANGLIALGVAHLPQPARAWIVLIRHRLRPEVVLTKSVALLVQRPVGVVDLHADQGACAVDPHHALMVAVSLILIGLDVRRSPALGAQERSTDEIILPLYPLAGRGLFDHGHATQIVVYIGLGDRRQAAALVGCL